MKNVFVYRLTALSIEVNDDSRGLEIKKWQPAFTRFIPPNSPFSYMAFWLMHYLNIFKSNDYCAYVIYKQKKPVSSLVCVPSLYRWSFMELRDIQIKNVFTRADYRGKGYAFYLVQHAIKDMGISGRSYWYMTDESNIPSQKLCNKIGFKYVGEYKRTRNKFFFYKGKILPTKDGIKG